MKNDGITLPKGFLAAGVNCGIKKSGKPDLAIIACPTGARAAAVFTSNRIVSAAVTVCREHVKSPRVSAVIVNSGNANACTGEKGIEDAEQMCVKTAAELASVGKGFAKTAAENVLVASTGVIGRQMPMEKVCQGITRAATCLSASASAGRDFATAIMTTDKKVKYAARRLTLSGADFKAAGPGDRIHIGGTVKGAGMVAPNMATTLLFLTTDADISKPILAMALKKAVGATLNKLTVDGHQSTNDTAIILASGLASNRPISSACPRYRRFEDALTSLCDELTRCAALDAEGSTRLFKVVVSGAASHAHARRAARAIADYPLVKCAVHGTDPNWGRIICAVGSCGVKFAPAALTCRIGDVTVFKNGGPCDFNEAEAHGVMKGKEHTISVDLGAGRFSDYCYGCDLSSEYIRINAHYRT